MTAVVASEVRIVFIYWIQSVSTGRDYVGITYNLSHRLLQHNGVIRGGAVATTKDPGPWIPCKVVTAHDGP
eukprot:scaffold1774_cov121-Isochrysis_galbana.AAC.3